MELVHRDVKPANILIVEHPMPGRTRYLTDFGITRELVDTADLTQTGVFMGTVDYASPEQVGGHGAGPAADQYALAGVAYECLTGRPPCKREHDMATLWAHVNEPPEPRVRPRAGPGARGRHPAPARARQEPGRPLADVRGVRREPRERAGVPRAG